MHSFCAVVSFFVVYPLSQSLRLCQLPQGGAFRCCRKVPATAISRPLGEGGCERSEQTEGVNLPFSSTTPPVKMQCRSVRRRSGIALLKIILPLQRRRPPPVAETGRSCWGSGQQDASAAQGTMRMLGAATRKTRRAFKIVPRASLPDMSHPLFCIRKVWYTENSILCPEGG